MARTDTLEHYLTDVASAIKEKKGDSTPILASDFDTEIANLPGGGSGLDWTAIGYNEEPDVGIEEGYNYALQIKNNWTSSTSLSSKFLNNHNIIFMPLVDTSSATTTQQMFRGCYKLITIPQLNTGNVTDMSSMFYYCYSLRKMSLLNTSKTTNMSSMFYSCISLEEIPQLDTSSVTNMSDMFGSCEKLKTIPQLDTSSVTNMSDMFSGCKLLTDESLDNILQMCINATNYTGTKVLKNMGFQYMKSTYPVSRIQSLTHYQDFIDAGWTIGY